jgi:hypothetical protein
MQAETDREESQASHRLAVAGRWQKSGFLHSGQSRFIEAVTGRLDDLCLANAPVPVEGQSEHHPSFLLPPPGE